MGLAFGIQSYPLSSLSKFCVLLSRAVAATQHDTTQYEVNLMNHKLEEMAKTQIEPQDPHLVVPF